MSEVLFDRVGRAGLITLSRPKALNALSRAMCQDMSAALDEWAADDRVERVVIRGEGKAFCAGGDIRALYDDRDSGPAFFWDEYQLDARVAQFPKPYVALVDGIVMGGGVGVSVHGSHRVMGEGVMFAMPEVGIGLFPDVGARHVLARLPREAGTYLGLTGARLSRDAAVWLGLGTHGVASSRMGDALDRTAHAGNLDQALDELSEAPEPWPEAECAAIEAAFAGADLSAIVEAAAAAEDSEMVAGAAAAMAQKSPTSMAVTLAALRRAADEDLAQTFITDYRIVRRILDGHDLFEGIRAVVISKDNAPRWSPATLAGVDADAVAAHFDEPEGGDLVLGERAHA